MKFITEDDLRDLYKIEPFITYHIEPGTRLTPGARQFLLDRGMDLYEKDFQKNNGGTPSSKQAEVLKKKEALKSKKLVTRLKTIESLFLITSEELIIKDVCLAQRVVELSRCFSSLRKLAEGVATEEKLFWNQCTGMNTDNFSDDLDDCFEITDFHIQLEKGREIIVLHRLRCQLHEMQLFIQEYYENEPNEKALYEEMAGKVNTIINCLSQMICAAFGGEKCQRQN